MSQVAVVSEASTNVRIPMVEFFSVAKRYGAAPPILENINFTIARGEFVSVIGPSGCGKSTILKLISGLTAPSGGSLRIDGLSPKDARETVSYIFQDPTLLPWRSVRDNVALGLELEGIARNKRAARVGALLDLVGLASVADAYPRELSGGMKMRASIARALATSPRLLLLDEPFAALDEMTRDRLNEELLRIRAEQKWTAVFVTHSVAEAVFLSTRIVVLASNPGRVHTVISVPFGPVRRSDLRDTDEFDECVLRVSRALREAFAP